MTPEKLTGVVSGVERAALQRRQKEEGGEEYDRNLQARAEACAPRAEAVMNNLRTFVRDIAPEGAFDAAAAQADEEKAEPQEPLMQRVVLGDYGLPELGDGIAVAKITAHHGASVGYDRLGQATRFEVDFILERGPVARNLYLAGEAFDQDYVMHGLHDPHKARERRIAIVEDNITGMERDATDTLTLLYACARDETLNPDLAARLRERAPLPEVS
jgi:hypothetical protein